MEPRRFRHRLLVAQLPSASARRHAEAGSVVREPHRPRRCGLRDGSTIVALAHTLQIDVVGEGVETPDQLAALGEFGCDYAQGFLFAPALDAAGADRLIAEQPWRMPSLISADEETRRAVRHEPRHAIRLVS